MTAHGTAWPVGGVAPVRTSPEGEPYTFTDFLQEALTLRAWGWVPCPVGPDKRPAAGWKRLQFRRPTDREISHTFHRVSRVGGVAVLTGGISGGRGWVLGVRDYDRLDAYEEWAAAHPDLAEACPTVLTPRPGAHVYCRLRGPDLYLGMPDGELRADRRHIVVVPPSSHPSGGVYRWVNRPTSPRDLPLLDVAESGFVSALATGEAQAPRHHATFSTRAQTPRRRGHRSWEQAHEEENALCAKTALSDLPLPVREAVLRTLPARPGTRNRCLLRLARSLADLTTGVPAAHWTAAVFAWWRLALPVIRTKEWATTWADFGRAWRIGRVTMADSRPITRMTEQAFLAGSDPQARLLAACRALATESPGDVFYLSHRTAGQVAAIPYRSAGRMLDQLVTAGILIVVQRGRPSPRRRVATYYRLADRIVPSAG